MFTLIVCDEYKSFESSEACEDVSHKESYCCRVSPESSEGPFYIDEDIFRENVTEGKVGHPISLDIDVVDDVTCEPIKDAKVSIWSCDSQGVYSGFIDQPPLQRVMKPTDDHRWLRGSQWTNEKGRVHFDTIFPSFYSGRSAHIHVRVTVLDKIVYIGQLYFEDSIIGKVVSNPIYSKKQRTMNLQDGHFVSRQGHKMVIPLKFQDHLKGTIKIVVNKDNQSKEQWG